MMAKARFCEKLEKSRILATGDYHVRHSDAGIMYKWQHLINNNTHKMNDNLGDKCVLV